MSASAVRDLTVSCLRCGSSRPAFDRSYGGCPVCQTTDGKPSNLYWQAEPSAVRAAALNPTSQPGIWRFQAALPPLPPITLGEGNTPLLELPRLAAELGLQRLYAKNESVNPTWSHKDRLAAVTVAAANASGADVVAVASTGNHGAAVAAYAARAGLSCVIATLPTVPQAMHALMLAYGATVVATETSEQRYQLIGAGVEEHGWYPASNLTMPPVGSDPLGIAGYTTIAYELVEQLGQAPDWVVVPVAYGDCLAGIVRGFAGMHAAELIDRQPRVLAVELFGALEHELAGRAPRTVATHPSRAFSIAAAATTYQAIAAVKAAGGRAHSVSEEEITTAQALLGTLEGLCVEAAAAAPFAAAHALAQAGGLQPDAVVVCLLTSSGLKDLQGQVQYVPTIDANLNALRATLYDAHKDDAVNVLFPGPTGKRSQSEEVA